MSADVPGDYDVGYGRPPKTTQFRKGRSGNPSGRPKRKPDEQVSSSPGIHPTRSILREEAMRPVAVREGENRYEISTTEAVVRSLAKQALAGGVLAARTYLEYQAAEDERVASEREETFGLWRDYAARERERMARAKACGEKMPEPVPHPDDIVLNYTDREVRFEGPLTLEKANEAKELRDLSHLFYELAAYHGHQYDLDGDTGDLKGSYWIACFLVLQESLPRRLRGLPDTLHEAMLRCACLPKRRWRASLENRFDELELPADMVSRRVPMVSLTEIGFDPLLRGLLQRVRQAMDEDKPIRYRARRRST